jgi:ribosome modulation factor
MSDTEPKFPVNEVHAAWQEGYDAFDANIEHPDPPYEAGSLEAESWLDGWDDRQEDIKQQEK